MQAKELKERMKRSKLWDSKRVPAQKLSVWTSEDERISYTDGRRRLLIQFLTSEGTWTKQIPVGLDDICFNDDDTVRILSWEVAFNYAIGNSSV